ncbi:unnamed protein product [Caenorhabditis sp. 36 PRJEB53466]|nr:unnamed protein product [Caenorhabditis sp. 36 PRJEB53466]
MFRKSTLLCIALALLFVVSAIADESGNGTESAQKPDAIVVPSTPAPVPTEAPATDASAPESTTKGAAMNYAIGSVLVMLVRAAF